MHTGRYLLAVELEVHEAQHLMQHARVPQNPQRVHQQPLGYACHNHNEGPQVTPTIARVCARVCACVLNVTVRKRTNGVYVMVHTHV